jgi:tellurite resistance protein TerC
MAEASVGDPTLWLGFIAFVLAMLALDLGLFHRKAHVVGLRESLGWTGLWIALSLVFGAGLWWRFGADAGLEFLTGYLIEKSLSIDNLFVFILVFAALGIPSHLQHRVLFWGVVTALVLRAGMIFAGAALLARFHWLAYAMGGFLVVSGARLLLARRDAPGRAEPGWMRLVRRIVPSTTALDGDRFTTVRGGRRVATPPLMALLLVESSDVVFAIDSIPAIFAITEDPFIVFTSNIFALLGLRSLYFAVAGLMTRFRYLQVGLAAVLVFIGAKMAAVGLVKVPPAASLLVVLGLLGAAMAASSLAARRERGEARRAARLEVPQDARPVSAARGGSRS